MKNKLQVNSDLTVNQSPKIERKIQLNFMKDWLGEDFRFHPEVIIRNRKFIAYVVCLLLLTIWNSHSTEKLIRQIEKTRKENKELRSQYISSLSQLMSRSRQSALAVMLESSGIHESKNPPVKIYKNEQ